MEFHDGLLKISGAVNYACRPDRFCKIRVREIIIFVLVGKRIRSCQQRILNGSINNASAPNLSCGFPGIQSLPRRDNLLQVMAT